MDWVSPGPSYLFRVTFKGARLHVEVPGAPLHAVLLISANHKPEVSPGLSVCNLFNSRLFIGVNQPTPMLSDGPDHEAPKARDGFLLPTELRIIGGPHRDRENGELHAGGGAVHPLHPLRPHPCHAGAPPRFFRRHLLRD